MKPLLQAILLFTFIEPLLKLSTARALIIMLLILIFYHKHCREVKSAFDNIVNMTAMIVSANWRFQYISSELIELAGLACAYSLTIIERGISPSAKCSIIMKSREFGGAKLVIHSELFLYKGSRPLGV